MPMDRAMPSRPISSVTLFEFRQDAWHKKTKSPWAVMCCLGDHKFSRSDTITACDGHIHKMIAYMPC